MQEKVVLNANGIYVWICIKSDNLLYSNLMRYVVLWTLSPIAVCWFFKIKFIITSEFGKFETSIIIFLNIYVQCIKKYFYYSFYYYFLEAIFFQGILNQDMSWYLAIKEILACLLRLTQTCLLLCKKCTLNHFRKCLSTSLSRMPFHSWTTIICNVSAVYTVQYLLEISAFQH